MNLTFSISKKKKINMFGFHSNFGADLAVAATASCSFVLFRAVSCLNGYPGIETSVDCLLYLVCGHASPQANLEAKLQYDNCWVRLSFRI